MTVEIISWSISTKVWDRAGIELATPGSAVRLASVARHVTDYKQGRPWSDLILVCAVCLCLFDRQLAFDILEHLWQSFCLALEFFWWKYGCNFNYEKTLYCSCEKSFSMKTCFVMLNLASMVMYVVCKLMQFLVTLYMIYVGLGVNPLLHQSVWWSCGPIALAVNKNTCRLKVHL